MAFRVFGDPNRVNEDTFFRLIEKGDGTISLIVTDKSGNRIESGSMLDIGPHGIYIHNSFSGLAGIALDDFGKVVILD